MVIAPAIYALLSGNQAVVDAVGGSIFPNEIPQETKTFPMIVYTGENAEFVVTMDGPTKTGHETIKVVCIHPDSDVTDALGLQVMSALLGQKGSFAGIWIKGIFFQDNDERDEAIPEMGDGFLVHVKEIAFKVWFRLP